jgi:uncharacterized membrane protein
MPKLISVGEIIDRTWETYRAGFTDFMSVSGWLLLIALVDVVALVFYPLTSTLIGGGPLTGGQTFGVALYWISRFIVAPIVSLWMFLALAKVADARLSGSRPNLKAAMRQSWQQFFPAAWVASLVTLILIAAFAIGLGPGALLGGIGALTKNNAIGLVASVLLAVGVVVTGVLLAAWSVSYAYAGYAIALDDARGMRALSQSRALVRGRFWAVVWRMLVTNAAFIILGLIASLAFGVLSTLVISAFGGLNLEVTFRLKSVSDAVFPTVVAVLLNPMLTIANVIIYRDLKNG